MRSCLGVYTARYSPDEPDRADIDARKGRTLLEFGADWCGICAVAQPAIARGLADAKDLTHFKIADGPGRPLGRSFKVKLWPTLILMQDGVERGRVVRPSSAAEVADLVADV